MKKTMFYFLLFFFPLQLFPALDSESQTFFNYFKQQLPFSELNWKCIEEHDLQKVWTQLFSTSKVLNEAASIHHFSGIFKIKQKHYQEQKNKFLTPLVGELQERFQTRVSEIYLYGRVIHELIELFEINPYFAEYVLTTPPLFLNKPLKHSLITFIALLYGINPDSRDQSGNTLLIKTIKEYKENYSETVVNMLLLAGADPNLQDPRGETALHHAVHIKNRMILHNLLGSGANPLIQNNRKETAQDLAKRSQIFLNTALHLAPQNIKETFTDMNNFRRYCKEIENDLAKAERSYLQ